MGTERALSPSSRLPTSCIPLRLPAVTVGTVDSRSIMEPIRYITRHKQAEVQFYEADCTDIDVTNNCIEITGT